MPNDKNQQNGQIDSHRRGRLGQKSSSFYSQNVPTMSSAQLRRPKTVPDLVSYIKFAGTIPEGLPRQPPKLLLNVTMMGSLGPVQVVMTPESTVGDLVAAAVRQYAKEGRRPILPTADPSSFDLHYSQFSLESLDKEEKLIALGARNFVLCLRKCSTVDGGAGNGESVKTPYASCSKQAEKLAKSRFGWLKFMDFLL